MNEVIPLVSQFSWIDFTEEDKNRMADVIRLFAEQDTRDELGFGAIRDAIADLLFPGTSTIQTRAKYFLFVPWIYRKREREQVPSSLMAGRIHDDEVRLIRALARSTDTAGLIGKDRGDLLQRFPSSVYWGGLNSWGIRLFRGSQSQYNRYLDPFYSTRKSAVASDDREMVDVPRQNWDPTMPESPRDFLSSTSFALDRDQAEYLRDKIMLNCRGSLLAHLVNRTSATDCSFPWMHDQYADFSEALKTQLHHARCFSELTHGTAILYNYLLAVKCDNSGLCERYLELFETWARDVEQRLVQYRTWDTQEFWGTVSKSNPRISAPARRFVNEWIRIVLEHEDITSLLSNRKAKQMITVRELQLKGSRARLSNKRALELWSGESALGQLSYRWPQVQTVVSDILSGLQSQEVSNA